MSNENAEYSEGGSRIYRHGARQHADKAMWAPTDQEALTAIEAHLAKYVGSYDMIFHEIISDYVHIDLHLIPPTTDHDFYTLVTSGMSDLPMTVPTGAEDWQYAELMLCLPSSWKMSREDWKNEDNYWPVRLLKLLARLPHLYNTWLCYRHTIPNGDPPEPYASNTHLCGAIVAAPVLFEETFRELTVRPDKVVRFYSVVPLYQEEMDCKLQHGTDGLFDKFDEYGVSELLNIHRPNVCL